MPKKVFKNGNFDPNCSENEILGDLCFLTKIKVLLVETPYFKVFSSITFEQIGADE